jgi:hypothetical protein
MIFRLLTSKSSVPFPQQRDPRRNPKCYELTDEERLEAARRVDELLKERIREHEQGYYGA